MIMQTSVLQENLRNLRRLMPGQKGICYEFADFLADRLDFDQSPEISPGGYVMVAVLSIYDLRKGCDDREKPLETNLAGCSDQTYRFLELLVPEIAKVVCESEEFSKEVVREFSNRKIDYRK
jgi:hypothetical protein